LTLSFSNGYFSISTSDMSVGAGANGDWPGPVEVDAGWVIRAAKPPLRGTVVLLRVERERLYANNYSEPCKLVLPKAPARRG
jgi:hypothetical protein